MIDEWAICVFRWGTDRLNCLELWYEEVERLQTSDIRNRLEAAVDKNLDLIRQSEDPEDLDDVFFPLADRGDCCFGKDALKFVSDEKHRRVIGVRDYENRQFGIFFADDKDWADRVNRNPKFYGDACPEVDVRFDAVRNGGAHLDEC